MVKVAESLSPDQLYTSCDSELVDFDTTESLEPLNRIIGQERATEAIQFGIGIERDGYNVFALGPRETDKENLVRHFLDEKAASMETPGDWCYVHNFEQPHKPRALTLPTGLGRQFREDMDSFTAELRTALAAAFESEEYQTRRQVIEEQFQEEQQESFEELQEMAQEKGLTLLRTPAGFAFAPIRDGEVVPPSEIQNMPEDKRERLEENVDKLQSELQRMLRKMPGKQRKLRDQIRQLNEEIARLAAQDLIREIREKYKEIDVIQAHLDNIADDIVSNVNELIQRQGPESEGISTRIAQMQQAQIQEQMLQRYKVNDLIDHTDSKHAPVIYENNPTLQNLCGRVEYRAQMGALLTDFTLIKQGALHRANGGYLMLDARDVLSAPLAWEALKRSLSSGEIRIQSLQEAMGFVSTVSLEPEPIPLDVKVVLLGERWIYYLLHAVDPEFSELFKVEADFDEQMDRSDQNQQLYARLIASMVQEMELRPLDRSAVARVIEHSARKVSDAEKLSTATREVKDLLREADFMRRKNGREVVSRTDVDDALEARRHRTGRIRERLQENILRDTLFIDTDGTVTGQVNGLSVLEIGRDTFGRPSRITARVRLGTGDVVDIEREVELGGPIHSKGVLILSSFLGARYAEERPLSLSAGLVFEQSYGGIEGDSASSSELYALLSAIAEVPLKQSLAVTGSVNQHGQVQPIGGVNEKIEGYFDICSKRGLTGEHGVLIPASNVKNLMLRREVVEAVERGEFHIYPVVHIDDGMELLTGMPMGERLDDGSFPEDTINRRVADRLQKMAERRTAFMRTSDNDQLK